MAYQIDRYNNTLLTIVEDGTIDSTTDLRFVGKNYAGYGEIQNENFLYLLENFAGANQPPRALSGQIWFDSANSKLKFYDGNQWRTTGGSEISSSEPTGLSEGDFWWDTANQQLYVYNGTNFVLVGPENAGSNITRMQSRVILDNQGNNRNVVVSVIDDQILTIYSPVEFTIDASNAIPGFNIVRRGVTMIDTDSTGITASAYRFWGTATNAEKLGGVAADEYILKSNATFTETTTFESPGIQILDNNTTPVFKIFVEQEKGVVQNDSGINSEIVFKTVNGFSTITNSTTVTSQGMMPGETNTYNIGSTALKWDNIYANTFTGTATQADTLRVDGQNYRIATTGVSQNTVAARDGSSNLSANVFQGTASEALYADLAEKYTTDQEYPVGTVMTIGAQEEYEMCAAGSQDIITGVISENPAYLMNKGIDGQAVALKGRVPVRVAGAVNKGEPVYAGNDGVASAKGTTIVGIALETNTDESEKLVECYLKF